MTQHTDLIALLRANADMMPTDSHIGRQYKAAADALEATAKNALEAMPHDIQQRMKDAICEETGWSGSMVSRMYTELRKAFTGEPYKANEDLDAALLEIERLRKDAALVAARERERCANLVLTTDAWRNAGWVSTICPTTKHAIAAAIRALNTEGEGNDATMTQKGGE